MDHYSNVFQYVCQDEKKVVYEYMCICLLFVYEQQPELDEILPDYTNTN